jgi:hypothetical protein
MLHAAASLQYCRLRKPWIELFNSTSDHCKTRIHVCTHSYFHVFAFVESICASQAAACAWEYSPGPKDEEPSFAIPGLAE